MADLVQIFIECKPKMFTYPRQSSLSFCQFEVEKPSSELPQHGSLAVLQTTVHSILPALQLVRRLDGMLGTTFGLAPIAQRGSVWSPRWT